MLSKVGMVAFAALAAVSTFAANTCVWTGLGHDGLWSTEANWKDEVVPVSGNGDTVIISDDIGDANLYFVNGTNTVIQDIADDFSLGQLFLANSNKVIHVTGKSLRFTGTSALRVAWATANSGASGKMTTEGGTIDNDLTFTKDNSYIIGGLKDPRDLIFNGRIDATGFSLELRVNSNNANSHIYFNGPVYATTLLTSKSWMQMPVYFRSPTNEIGTIKSGYGQSSTFDGFQPFPDYALPILNFDTYYASQGCCSYDLRGDVTVDSIQSTASYRSLNTDGTPKLEMMFIRQRATPSRTPTLTLRPAAGRQATAYAVFATPTSTCLADSVIKANLVLDGAADAVQTFWNRRHRMNGSIAVRAGTLNLAGTTTFEDVKSLEVAAGATLTTAVATNSAMFKAVTNVALVGTLTVGENVADMFGDGSAVTLRLTTGAKLKFEGASRTLKVCKLYVDGENKPSGTFISRDFIEGGDISVERSDAPFPEPAVYTWTGNGADNKISTTGNFKEGDPDLTTEPRLPLALVAKVADAEAADRTMTLDRDYSLYGLIFDGAAGTVADGTGSALLRLAKGGLTVTKPTDAETVSHVIETPVSPMMNQVWDVQTNALVELAKGVVTDPYPFATPIKVAKTGGGRMLLKGSGGGYACDYVISNGYVIATGDEPFGAGAKVEIRTQYSKKGARVVFSNVVTSASFVTDSDANQRNAFDVADRTTNVISGSIKHTAVTTLTIPSKAYVVFAGGYGDNYSCLSVAGTCVVSNMPMKASTYESGMPGLMVFACPSNTFGSMHRWQNSSNTGSSIDPGHRGVGFTANTYHIRLEADDALLHYTDGQLLMDASSWLDLNGHDTHIRNLHTEKGAKIYSYTGPATLYLVQQRSSSASYTEDGVSKKRVLTASEYPVNHTFEGEVSLVKSGTNVLMLAGCHGATGSVTVAQGVLSFTNRMAGVTASWTNATAVTVKNGATLETWNAKIFNRHTALTLGEAAGETGTLAFGNAANDVTGTMRVGELWVNGVKMPNGRYGAADNASLPSEQRLSCITGKGTVQAGAPGGLILVR